MGPSRFSPKAQDAMERLGVDPDKILINEGVAEFEIGLSDKLSRDDINLVLKELGEMGAESVSIGSGQVFEPRLRNILNQLNNAKYYKEGGAKFFNKFEVTSTGNPNNEFILEADL